MSEEKKSGLPAGASNDGKSGHICSDEPSKSLARNLARFRAEVSEAALACGRDPAGIQIVPATKTQTIETINALLRLGIDAAGENRVQELIEKYPLVQGVEWHLIGQLQTNKVKYILDKVCMIESLDRMPLAQEIERQAAKRGIVIPCLVEINIARITTHGGVLPEDALAFVEAVRAQCPHIALKGIMGVLPRETGGREEDGTIQNDAPELSETDRTACEDTARAIQMLTESDGETRETEHKDNNATARAAAQMEKLSKTLAERYPDMIECSMGMSEDFSVAIRYGATILRPGRVLFGERRIPVRDGEGNEQV